MFKKLKELLSSKNTLYYPGCLTQTVLPKIQKNYENILNTLGIDYIYLKTEINCCGSPAHNAGYKQDFETLKEKNKNILNEYSIGKIITNCPACYHILKTQYNIEVIHTTQLIAENLKKLNLNNNNKETITYHDPCRLGRHLGIYEQPRKVIAALPGIELVEMEHNKEESLCCGTSAFVNCDSCSKQIRVDRLLEAKATGADTLITSCPKCQIHFRCAMTNKGEEKGPDVEIEVMDLVNLVANALGDGHHE